MQVRKTEVERAILKKAEIEFYRFGFKDASLRRIIKSSGTSIGNFYNYFRSKDALFEALVGEEYNRFTSFLNKHQNVENESFVTEFSVGEKDWRQRLDEIEKQLLPDLVSQMIPDFNMRFVILIEGSKGTKYENASKRLINLIKDHFDGHTREEGIKMPEGLNRLLAEQFLTGIIKIIKMHKGNKRKRNLLLTDFILFFFAGAMSLFVR